MRGVLLLALAGLFAGMAGACADRMPRAKAGAELARRAIQAQITRSAEATRRKDIATYMDCIPDGWVVRDENGAVIGRDELRRNALRDWAIIVATTDIDVRIDSLQLVGDSAATVYTFQRWERLMLERDGVKQDTVITTQRHREHWRRTPVGWRGYEVEELGGTVLVNGRPYP
jgi:ketosteroid isomerase-like protein